MSTAQGQRTVCDRYELHEVLGRGGMGTVWRARDLRLQRDVAVKEVRLPDEVDDDDRSALEARALREARAAARLSGGTVVTVFDVQQDDGRVYLVMELIDGPSLDDVVRDQGPLDPRRAAGIALDVVTALEAAHSAGVVHRDVKPANIMLPEAQNDQGGGAKLADFGIASLKDDPKITKTGLILGSPSYMAPEQVKGNNAEPATDLWALGATLYYAVEGRAPFEKGQAIPTLASVVDDEPPPMHGAGPLGPIIEGLLNKEPAARPTVPELKRRLEGVVAGKQVGAVPPATPATTFVLDEPPAPARHVEPELVSAPPRPARPQRTSRLGSILAGAALLLVVAAVAAFALLGGRETPRENSGPGNRGVQREDRGGPGTGSGGGSEVNGSDEAATEDFTEYEDPVGYTVSYPPGWEVEADSLGDGSSTDFHDPGSGAYLRVDWQSPPGDDAVQAWEDQEQTFAAEHEGYQRIGEIEEYGFKGYEGAWWEFTWEEDGITYHAVDLGFIVRDEYGFALNFVAPEESWADLQDEWEAIRESYTAPPPA